jgi:hypothetical protein
MAFSEPHYICASKIECSQYYGAIGRDPPQEYEYCLKGTQEC